MHSIISSGFGSYRQIPFVGSICHLCQSPSWPVLSFCSASSLAQTKFTFASLDILPLQTIWILPLLPFLVFKKIDFASLDQINLPRTNFMIFPHGRWEQPSNKGIGDAGSTADIRMLWSAMVCLGLL